jgi:hypothetical protein
MGFGSLQRISREKRPTPGLPHPAVLRSQAFSTSQRFIPSPTVPVLFHTGSTRGILDPAEFSPPEDRPPFGFPSRHDVACRFKRRDRYRPIV